MLRLVLASALFWHLLYLLFGMFFIFYLLKPYRIDLVQSQPVKHEVHRRLSPAPTSGPLRRPGQRRRRPPCPEERESTEINEGARKVNEGLR